MTIPPATWNPDGSYTFTIVGRDADIRAAVDSVPADVRVDIESVGGKRVATDGVDDELSRRQRDAVRTAIELGYYDIPRGATSEDVASELDRATSTAAEHLRKAEATVVVGPFGNRQQGPVSVPIPSVHSRIVLVVRLGSLSSGTVALERPRIPLVRITVPAPPGVRTATVVPASTSAVVFADTASPSAASPGRPKAIPPGRSFART